MLIISSWFSFLFIPVFVICIFMQFSLSTRQEGAKQLDQAGQEGMLLLVLCRVGMLSVILDMVRLVSQLLRFVVTQEIPISHIYFCRTVQGNDAFHLSWTGQELEFFKT